MLWLSFLGLGMISIVGLVYMLYFVLVLRNRKSISSFQEELLLCHNSNSGLDPVSFIVSTFNEAKVIGRKLENIAELDYPSEKLEVLVIDDDSSDGSADIAKKKIQELNINGKVIRNSKRLGLNRSLNIVMKEAKHNFVCISDSDVVLKKDALKNSVKVLKSFEDAGGVTGKLNPFFEEEGVAQRNERVYREFYDNSMLSESSLHSCFPGNGTLMVFDKSRVPFSIPADYGASDANIAMNVIKSGLRFLYVPSAEIFEHVPENVKEQRMQKIRRAKRLTQVFIHNLDIFGNKKYGNFGRIVFPLKLLIVTLCPILLFSGIALFAASVFVSQNFGLYIFSLVVSLLILLGLTVGKIRSTFSSFFFHQFFLLFGFIASFRKSVTWKTIERK